MREVVMYKDNYEYKLSSLNRKLNELKQELTH